MFSLVVLKFTVCPSTIFKPVKTLFYWPLAWKAKDISRPLWWNSPWVLVNSNKRLEPKWAWVSQLRWLVSRTPESLPSSTAAPWCSNSQEPSPLITPQWERKKQLIANRNAGASVGTQIMSRGHLPCLGFSQCSLDPGELSPVIGDVPLFFHSEHLRILNQRERESTVKIFEQSIQTPCGSYWRQAAREQLLRMGNEDMAETRRQFTVIFFPLFFLSWAAKMALIYSGTYW